jgi:hypothetical protein
VNDPIRLEHELTKYALGQANPLAHTWLGDRLREDLRKSTSSMIALSLKTCTARGFAHWGLSGAARIHSATGFHLLGPDVRYRPRG